MSRTRPPVKLSRERPSFVTAVPAWSAVLDSATMPPLLALRLLLLLVAASAAADDDEETLYDASMCQTSFPCGERVNVHYPFFLANATRSIEAYTAYSYCGYPGMAIACDGGGRATLALGGGNYTVLDIDYDNHTVTVADADALRGGDCPRVARNVTVPAETWLNLSATANDNLSFFFDCVFNGGVAPPGNLPPINCSGFPRRDGVSFVAPQPFVPPREEWPRACKSVVVVPVLRYWLLSPDAGFLPRLNSDGYGKVLKQGFQLSWDPSAGPCYVCEQSRGQCSYNQSGEFLGCLCSDGRVRNPDCAAVALRAAQDRQVDH